MRVTAVSTWFPTQEAPARGSFVLRDLQAIARHADVRLVHLVAPQDDDGTRRLVWKGIDVVRVPMTPADPRSVLRAAAALPALLAGADVVHSMALSSLLPLTLHRPRVPWVHTEHWSALTTPATLPPLQRRAVPVIARLERGPDVVTAVCDFLARPIRAVRGDRPITIVPCIVDPVRLAPRRDRSDGTLRLVSTGGLIDRKDPLCAVDTLAELARRGTDARLVWLGEGPLREATLARAAALGVASRVDLVGSRSPAEVRVALGQADLFFGPTRADNFFVSAAEAIVSGRPVVLGATGGHGEYVDDAVGALVDTQDPVRYADAIETVDARTRDLSSEQIAATIGDAFSSANVGEQYAAVYADVLTRRRGRAALRPLPARAAAREVEVVIACHSARRPLDRAVASVLDGSGDVAAVRVVAHNLPAADLRAALRPQDRDRVIIDELSDGIASPTGPFQHGIEAGTSPFVAIMGSDDVLEPGAVASWLAVQRRTDADLVMPRLRLDGSARPVPTPPARPRTLLGALTGRPRLLDGIADRGLYRSAPLGLIRREAWARMGLTLRPGLAVGEDVDVAARLALHARTAADLAGPAYVVHDDATDRTTFVVRPLAQQLGFLDGMIHAEDSPVERRAVAVKCLRIHVFGAIHYRGEPAAWPPSEREALARWCWLLVGADRGVRSSLSRAEDRLLGLALDPGSPVEDLIAASAARRRHGRPGTLLPARPGGWTAPDGPLRFVAASALASLLPRR